MMSSSSSTTTTRVEETMMMGRSTTTPTFMHPLIDTLTTWILERQQAGVISAKEIQGLYWKIQAVSGVEKTSTMPTYVERNIPQLNSADSIIDGRGSMLEEVAMCIGDKEYGGWERLHQARLKRADAQSILKEEALQLRLCAFNELRCAEEIDVIVRALYQKDVFEDQQREIDAVRKSIPVRMRLKGRDTPLERTPKWKIARCDQAIRTSLRLLWNYRKAKKAIMDCYRREIILVRWGEGQPGAKPPQPAAAAASSVQHGDTESDDCGGKECNTCKKVKPGFFDNMLDQINWKECKICKEDTDCKHKLDTEPEPEINDGEENSLKESEESEEQEAESDSEPDPPNIKVEFIMSSKRTERTKSPRPDDEDEEKCEWCTQPCTCSIRSIRLWKMTKKQRTAKDE